MTQMGLINKAIAGVGGVGRGTAANLGMLATSADVSNIAMRGLHASAILLQAALAGVVAVVGILAGGLVALGAVAVRAATFSGIVGGFNNMANAAGVAADVLLIDLRRAAAGTISDLELLRSSNLALAGATGEFATAFASALPRILEVARNQARTTGQSVEYLYNSLITGIKRAEPRLIDNTGIIIKVRNVYEQFAASLGKTAAELTLTERQLAILNATLTIGEEAISRTGELAETNSEKIQRFFASIKNLLDSLGMALQPALAAVLDVVNQLLGGLVGFIRNAAPYVAAISEMFAGILGPVRDAIGSFANLLSNPEFARGFFMGGARMIGALAGGIAAAANQYVFPTIISIATFIADFLSGMSPPPKGPLSTIDIGGRNVMLAWLGGFLSVGMEPVKQVAAEVDAFLGDIGKMSLIGVETRLAALDLQLKPFQERLEIITNLFESMNKPAEAALDAIARQTDKALVALFKGEQGSAAIVRSLDDQREQLQSYVDTNESIVDQYQVQLALLQAQQEPERTLLNIQKARLGAVETAAKIVDATKKKTEPKGGTEKEPTGEGKPEVEESGGGGTPIEDDQSLLDLLNLSSEDIASASEDLKAAFLEGGGPALEAFGRNAGLLQQQLDRIGKANIGETIKERLQEITDIFFDETSEWSTSVEDTMMKIAAIFIRDPHATRENLRTLVATWLDIMQGFGKGVIYAFAISNDAISQFTTNLGTIFMTGLIFYGAGMIGLTEGLLQMITNLRTIAIVLADLAFDIMDDVTKRLGQFRTNMLTLAGIVVEAFQGQFLTLEEDVKRFGTNLITLADVLVLGWGQRMSSLKTNLTTLGEVLVLWWGQKMDELKTTIFTALETIFGPGTTEGTFLWHIINLMVMLKPLFEGFINQFKFMFLDPLKASVDTWMDIISLLFTGYTTEGVSFPQIMDAMIEIVSGIPERFGEAISGVADAVTVNFVNPIIMAINQVIVAFEEFMNSIRGKIADFAEGIAPLIEAIGSIPGFTLMGGQGRNLRTIAQALRAGQFEFDTIPLIDVASPPGTRGARGGVFGPGRMMVGERGPEIIATAQRMAVFPQRMIRAMEAFSSMREGGSAMVNGSVVNNITYNTDRSLTANFNGGYRDSGVMSRLSLMRAT